MHFQMAAKRSKGELSKSKMEEELQYYLSNRSLKKEEEILKMIKLIEKKCRSFK